MTHGNGNKTPRLGIAVLHAIAGTREALDILSGRRPQVAEIGLRTTYVEAPDLRRPASRASQGSGTFRPDRY